MGAFSASAMCGVPFLELHAGSRMTVTAASGAAAKPREKTVKSRESDHQGLFCYIICRAGSSFDGFVALGVRLNGNNPSEANQAVWPVRGHYW